MSARPSISVVHLVRRQNGLEPLRAFLASYHRVEAGAEHELVLVMKGFQTDRQRNEQRSCSEPDVFEGPQTY